MQTSKMKRLLSLLLAVIMLTGILASVKVFAEETDDEEPVSAEPETAGTEITIHDNLAGGDAGNPYTDYRERYKA